MGEDLTRHASLGGALVAAVAASACCVGPLALAALGLGGAGAFVALEPLRPLFMVVTFGLLGVGWTLAARARAEADVCGCEAPRTRRAGRGLLWLATAAALTSLAVPSLVSAGEAVVTEPSGSAAPIATHRATVAIEGMTCGSCAVTVKAALARLPGVAEVRVDVARGRAEVRFDRTRVDAERIAEAITEAGYPASVVSEREG